MNRGQEQWRRNCVSYGVGRRSARTHLGLELQSLVKTLVPEVCVSASILRVKCDMGQRCVYIVLPPDNTIFLYRPRRVSMGQDCTCSATHASDAAAAIAHKGRAGGGYRLVYELGQRRSEVAAVDLRGEEYFGHHEALVHDVDGESSWGGEGVGKQREECRGVTWSRVTEGCPVNFVSPAVRAWRPLYLRRESYTHTSLHLIVHHYRMAERHVQAQL